MPLRNLAWLLVIPALTALGLVVTYSAPSPDRDYQRVRKLVDVMAEVDEHFYRELTPEEKDKLTEDMINGGLYKLDPHSQYLNSAQLKQFESESEGSYGGIGIVLTIDPETKFLKVDSLLPGTPAYDAGIIANDLIVKIGETSTEGITIDDAKKLITGEPDTKVALTIRRANRNPTDEVVQVMRARIPQHPVTGIRRRADDPNKWEWFADKPGGIGYVHIASFNELTAKELKAAVEEIERDGGKALVIDLRGNPGGLLSQAIDVSRLFLPDGATIVSTRGREGHNGDAPHTREFKGEKGHEIFKGKPVTVLMDGDSASASEIVASALQDNGRAQVVGERSYGKGSVQKIFQLRYGDEKAAVKLTTERYWRPNGQNMDRQLASKEKPDEWGVMPNVEVATTKEEKLRAAIELRKMFWVAGKPSAVGPNPPQPPVLKGPDGKPLVDESKPFEDKQLKRATEVLKDQLNKAKAPGNSERPRLPGTVLPERVLG